ncbi:MAG: DUF192 domain-containing protein [Alphaproteobacteria bacterium]|nr:DUF192 domain-containing protein [Alphaproteobacteria bacterium]
MSIRTSDGKTISFSVEVATTAEQQTYGLMFRRSMPQDSGMLFIWQADQPITMWMKNTYIPLDMLFVQKDGTITKIATHTKPFDLGLISSDGPVRGVVELNAGEAGRHGLKVGDKVLFPAFSKGS